jgi:hypothetical protein
VTSQNLPLVEDKKWIKLCAFLGKDVPSAEYPWKKKAKMRAVYLVPRKQYIKKMSRVRFHQVEEIAKLCDLTYSGYGWDNYREDETLTQNLTRIYSGRLPDIAIVFEPGALKDFNQCEVPKVIMVNEMHDSEGDQQTGLASLEQSNYDFIVCHHKNEMESPVFDSLRDRMVHIPHHVNLSIFKDYGFSKDIDVLLGGALFLEKYELRRKFVKVIDTLKSRGVNAVIHKHPMGNFNDSHTNRYLIDFAKKINASKICLTCSSTLKCAYGKYSEIPACNTLLAGDIPGEREDFFRSFMLELTVKQSEKEMADAIQQMLEDKNRLEYLTKLGFIKTQAYDMKNYAKLFLAHVDHFLKARSA